MVEACANTTACSGVLSILQEEAPTQGGPRNQPGLNKIGQTPQAPPRFFLPTSGPRRSHGLLPAGSLVPPLDGPLWV